MQKARQTGEDRWLAVLTWRNTATTGFSTSPVQRLFGCRTNIGTLPVRRDLLNPETPQNAVEEFKRAKEQQKTRYNKNAHDVVPLSSNEQVWVQTVPGRSHWTKGKIIHQTRDQEYLVEVDGQRLTRNRQYVRLDMTTIQSAKKKRKRPRSRVNTCWKKMKERVQMMGKRVVGKWNTPKSLLGNRQN